MSKTTKSKISIYRDNVWAGDGYLDKDGCTGHRAGNSQEGAGSLSGHGRNDSGGSTYWLGRRAVQEKFLQREINGIKAEMN